MSEEKVYCDCPAKHDLTDPKRRGIMVSNPACGKILFLKLTATQHDFRCYNHARGTMRKRIREMNLSGNPLPQDQT
jgi:hypothetical protein